MSFESNHSDAHIANPSLDRNVSAGQSALMNDVHDTRMTDMPSQKGQNINRTIEGHAPGTPPLEPPTTQTPNSTPTDKAHPQPPESPKDHSTEGQKQSPTDSSQPHPVEVSKQGPPDAPPPPEAPKASSKGSDNQTGNIHAQGFPRIEFIDSGKH